MHAGTFIALGDKDFRLIWEGALHRWTPEGYLDNVAVDDAGAAAVVTPALLVAALRHGYRVTGYPSVRALANRTDY